MGYGTHNGSPLLATREGPAPAYQVPIIIHAFCCSIAFALVLPGGAILARYLRTFKRWWYTGHWIAQLGAGVLIVTGVALAVVANIQSGTALDNHKARKAILELRCRIPDLSQRTGFGILVVYILQCLIGAVVHFVKAKHARRRPIQNYFHAILGIILIAMGMYQIHTGYNFEWPAYMGSRLPGWVNSLWIIWCILLVVLYAAGLGFLRKQYAQEAAARSRNSHIVLGALEAQRQRIFSAEGNADIK
ncbi:hypothetical protein C8R47DRAFT_1320634 [Mycena vitilis]|nr:hypothetical protein C8R47DRAFT_1320634 [Mycena vitilis]